MTKTFNQFTQEIKGFVAESVTINVTAETYLKTFAERFSQAFQPDVPTSLSLIEKELNKFGYSLGELDLEDIPDEGDEDFIIIEYATKEIVKNLFLNVQWQKISGQQDVNRKEGSKLVCDIKINFEKVLPDEMEAILNSGEAAGEIVQESFEVDEDVQKTYKVKSKTASGTEITTTISGKNAEDAKEKAKLGNKTPSSVKLHEASVDDANDGTKHIIMSLRKASSLAGQYDVEFSDGTKHKVTQKEAHKALAMYDKLPKPVDKEKFQKELAKSYKDFKDCINESAEAKTDKIKFEDFSGLKNPELLMKYKKVRKRIDDGIKLTQKEFDTFFSLTLEINRRLQDRDIFWMNMNYETAIKESLEFCESNVE